jgi:hypothetical protein
VPENDYATRHQAELQAKWDKEAEIFRIQNLAMKTVLNECPLPVRTPENCRTCGNEACIKAYQEQQILWGEDNEFPVSHASGTNTGLKPENSKLPAPSQPFQGSKQCPPPGPFASGDLFSFVNNQPDEEAA